MDHVLVCLLFNADLFMFMYLGVPVVVPLAAELGDCELAGALLAELVEGEDDEGDHHRADGRRHPVERRADRAWN